MPSKLEQRMLHGYKTKQNKLLKERDLTHAAAAHYLDPDDWMLL